MKIGKLERINLRDVWSNEATDFTTWLNENLETLGEAVGLSLTESETEKKLENSSFHVDIATNTEDGRSVIIENQLEQTDHKHLGQILTYMINMVEKILKLEVVLKDHLANLKLPVNKLENDKPKQNKEFFDRLMHEMKEEHPDMNVRNLNSQNNCIKAVPSDSFSHNITIFRAVDYPRVGVFWCVRNDKDEKLLELMSRDADFPKDFKIDERGFENVKSFDDLYDLESHAEQIEFLKKNLLVAYEYIERKILEIEKDKLSKAS